jgi:hypothetical protein
MEEMDYNILFRWFVGLNLDDPAWDATVFTKNRNRLLEAEVAKEFLARVVEQAREKGWTSDEHFTVDGTLLEAWASMKSFRFDSGFGRTTPDGRLYDLRVQTPQCGKRTDTETAASSFCRSI